MPGSSLGAVRDVQTSAGFVAAAEKKAAAEGHDFSDLVEDADLDTSNDDAPAHAAGEKAAPHNNLGPTAAQVAEMLKDVDTDKDGKLSWNEVLTRAMKDRLAEIKALKAQGNFKRAKAVAWDAQSEKELKSEFKEADKNKDGFLSGAELPAMADAEASLEEEDEGSSEDEDEEGGEDAEHAAGHEEDDIEMHEGEDVPSPAQPASLLEQPAAEMLSLNDEEVDEDLSVDAQGDGHHDDVSNEDSVEELKQFMKKADTDKDGKLSLDEVKVSFGEQFDDETQAEAVTEEFKGADVNGDGFLDAHELEKLRYDTEGHDDEEPPYKAPE